MPKIKYESKNFRSDSLDVIQQAEAIIRNYQAQGFTLTLRQLYYQFVARALIPNTEQSYSRLGNIISDARRAGLIDWNAIIDRTRNLRKLSSWDTPQEILESAKDSYHRDLWENQDIRIEVWIEKDALIGVIEGICRQYDVPYFSCRGYVSDSEMWSAAMRVLNRHYQKTLILHLGDHDPSGIDMSRDIEDRINLFSHYDPKVTIHRIALTMEQVEEVNPPPNPAKIKDSRYINYVTKYSHNSWELDALEPRYLADLIEKHITQERDAGLWDELVEQQEQERGQIADVIERWNDLF